ncbi:hypothetical protein KEM55_006535 [Ascosphaera atra]|nr:hypothetical protein KEM55_006535 [Ascosphaera atra]
MNEFPDPNPTFNEHGGVAERPSPFWTKCSSVVMYGVAGMCRAFLYGASNLELNGHEEFFKLLESRVNYKERERGLITGNPND